MTPEEYRQLVDSLAPLPQGPVPQDTLAGRVGKWAFGPMVQTPRDRLIQSINMRNLIEDYVNKSQRQEAETPASIARSKEDEARAKMGVATIPFEQSAKQWGLANQVGLTQQGYGGGNDLVPTPGGMQRKARPSTPVSPVEGINALDPGPHPGENAPPSEQQAYYRRMGLPSMDAEIIGNAGNDQSFVAPLTPYQQKKRELDSAWPDKEAMLKELNRTPEEIAQAKYEHYYGPDEKSRTQGELTSFVSSGLKKGWFKSAREGMQWYMTAKGHGLDPEQAMGTKLRVDSLNSDITALNKELENVLIDDKERAQKVAERNMLRQKRDSILSGIGLPGGFFGAPEKGTQAPQSDAGRHAAKGNIAQTEQQPISPDIATDSEEKAMAPFLQQLRGFTRDAKTAKAVTQMWLAIHRINPVLAALLTPAQVIQFMQGNTSQGTATPAQAPAQKPPEKWVTLDTPRNIISPMSLPPTQDQISEEELRRKQAILQGRP